MTRILNRLILAVLRGGVSKHAHTGTLLAGLALVLLHAAPLRAQLSEDWLTSLRREVGAHHLTAALEIADQRLAAAPGDTDARGWRARTLAWLGHSREAEAEFRMVLAITPNDPDVLSGLAGVLVREDRKEEGLQLFNQAIAIDPDRADILEQRGSLLRSAEARSDFGVEVARMPAGETVLAGLDLLGQSPRHEFRVGSATDTFNYTDTANAETLALTSHWNPHWTTSFSGIIYQRFGANEAKFAGSISRRFGRTESLEFGGAVARDQGVIPRSEMYVEYGHGFRLSETHFFRGLETDFRSHRFWYRDAHVLALTSTAVFYVPRDRNLVIAITQARSAFSGAGAGWSPSGIAKVNFPLHPRITANVFFAVGAENFAQADQIGRFSARTFGIGAKYRLARQQDISLYVARQARSQGRTQTSFGVSYAFYF